MVLNPQEVSARAAKAIAMADALTERGASAESAARLDQVHRDIVAEIAGQRSPSEQTWALVCGLLIDRECRAAEAESA